MLSRNECSFPRGRPKNQDLRQSPWARRAFSGIVEPISQRRTRQDGIARVALERLPLVLQELEFPLDVPELDPDQERSEMFVGSQNRCCGAGHGEPSSA